MLEGLIIFKSFIKNLSIVYSFPRASITKHSKLGGLKQEKIYSLSYRDEKSKTKDYAIFIGFREGIFPCLF